MSGEPMQARGTAPHSSVIGNGMIARAFLGSRFGEDVVIFASGVSNSLETDPRQFDRERRLLETTLRERPQARLVYFGTCSAYDPDRMGTPYVHHKREMEALVRSSAPGSLVLRLPLVIGPNDGGQTLARQLYTRIRDGAPVEIWARALRYPIDIDDVVRITQSFVAEPPATGRSVNVALRGYPILDFVRSIEAIVGRKATVRLLERGASYDIPCPELRARAEDLGLDYSYPYLDRVLRKYFKP